jgi:hypothetical protein
MADEHILMRPFVVDSSNDQFDLEDSVSGVLNLSLAQGTYDDVISFLAYLDGVLTASWGNFNSIGVSSAGRVTISRVGGGTFKLFTSAANAVFGDLGYYTGTDTGFGQSLQGIYQHANAWYYEGCPEYDWYDRPEIRGQSDLFISEGGIVERLTTPKTHYTRGLKFPFVPLEKLFPSFAPTNEDWISFWNSAARGERVGLYTDGANLSIPSTTADGRYYIESPLQSLSESEVIRRAPDVPNYSMEILLRKDVSS